MYERGFETSKERYKRLVKDVTIFFGALSSGAGIYVLGSHALDANIGAIGHALWSWLSNVSNFWYDLLSIFFSLNLTQLTRNLISLYFILGLTTSRAWYVFSLERPIEYRFKGNRFYWDIPHEFVSETVCDSELRAPFASTLALPLLWPVLLPYLYWWHDGRGNNDFEDIPDTHESDGKSDWRIYVYRTRASYRKFFWFQVSATLTLGLCVMSADSLFG
ncbi:MAG: hypothetical protein AAGL69_16310 [Pseudomonadota bacterium]